MRGSFLAILLSVSLLFFPSAGMAWDPFAPPAKPEPKTMNKSVPKSVSPKLKKKIIVKELKWQYRDFTESDFIILGQIGDIFFVRFRDGKNVFRWKAGQVLKNCTMLKTGKLVCYRKTYKVKNENEKLIDKPMPTGGFFNVR